MYTHRKISQWQTNTPATIFQKRILKCKTSRQWSHGDQTYHWRPGFSRRWVLAPQENITWITLIPPSLLQHDKRYYSQYGTQSITAWPLYSFWCSYQPHFFYMHLRHLTPTSLRPLCLRLHIYLSDLSQEELLEDLLQAQIQVGFMGYVDYFLGTVFT